MATAKRYIPDITHHVEQALSRMPVKSSVIARRVRNDSLHMPDHETDEDASSYIKDLLSQKEQQVCDMATD